MIVVRSIALGLAAFAAEWVLAWLVLLVFSFAFDRLGVIDNSHTLRQALAVLLFTAVVVASVAVVVGGAFTFAGRARANPWLALGVASLLSGLTAYWLLQLISVINDCTVAVPFPYTWTYACSRA